MQEVLDFLRDNPVFYLATVEGDQPRVRPFGAVIVFEGKLYLITSKKKDVYRQLAENPKLEICTADAKGRWIRIEAVAAFDERDTVKRQMLEEYPSLQELYSVGDDIMAMVTLSNAVATFYSFSEAPRQVKW